MPLAVKRRNIIQRVRVINNRNRIRRIQKRLATRQYVKNAIRRKQETKKGDMLAVNNYTMPGNTVHWFNPTYQIDVGDNWNQRDGRVITDCKLNMNFCYTHLGRTSINVDAFPSSLFRLLVLSSNNVKAGVAAPNSFQIAPNLGGDFSPQNVFYQSSNLGEATVNKDRWTVHLDRTYESHRVTDQTVGQNGTGNTVFRKNISIPIHKRVTYRDTGNNSFLLQSEVYIVIVCSAQGAGITDKVGLFSSDALLTWTDS